jgi:signal transduction histidine kinase
VLIDGSERQEKQSFAYRYYGGHTLLSRAADVQGYVPAISALGIAFLIHVILMKLFGATFAGIFFVYLAAMIVAAWCGYLPGLLIVLVTTVGLSFLLKPDFSFKSINFGNVAAMMLMSLLISRTAEERRRAERALRNINAEVERRIREKTGELEAENSGLREVNGILQRTANDLDQFAQAATEDLQEPLRTISISIQLLREHLAGKLDQNLDHHTRQIARSSDKLENRLGDLRMYLAVAEKMEDSDTETDANKVLKRVVGNLKPEIERHQIRFTSTHLPRVPMREVHIEQVLQNLIENSVKYRSENQPEIHVSATRDQQAWLFSVRDNGIGIDPEYSEQIFGIFKRLHSSTYEGTGIGLALCRRIVERYEGRIWVESAPGRGATFLFTIPDPRQRAAAPLPAYSYESRDPVSAQSPRHLPI